MRFLIDLQCAQSGSRTRGIGRYALSLLDALLPTAKAQGHEIHLLLNSALSISIPDLQRRYADLHSSGYIHIFQGLEGISAETQNGPWRAAASALMRDMAIAGLAPDALFCPSLFEGDRENVALAPLTLSQTPVIGTQHDLIPAQLPEIYFDDNPAYKAFYEARMRDARSAAALICVSQSTRAETLELMGYPEADLHVVLEDADPRFAPPDAMSLNDMEDLRRRYGLAKPYVLYVGSGEPRKNLASLVKAYAALPHGLINSFDLVIAGNLTVYETADLIRLARDHRLDPGHIRLLGHTPDADLPALYGLAALFVLPALREGFGLPALEAIRCGTLTLGADTTSLPEVIGTPDALFAPTDVPALSALITRSLTDAAFRDDLIARQAAHAADFSWDKAAEETLAVFTQYAKETAPETDWPQVQFRLDDLEARTITALQALPEEGLTDRDRDDVARALVQTRLAIEAAWRPRALPEDGLLWRLEGPFDSSYSLASVNRETARALGARGVDVALVSAEGPGPFDADPDFLAAHPDLAAQHAKGQDTPEETAHILSRNMFPPRVADMRGPLNLLHGYAWEETGLPPAFTADMTAHLQGLLVTSPHVRRIFEDAGLGLPVHVVGNGVDHLEVDPAPLPVDLPKSRFTCLHVSSCFPRKGADVLLAAFGQAFGPKDDVALVIKTFPNPHNDIRDRAADMPHVTVIEDDLSPAQMRSLYAAADLLVAPSRAEGYCLPVAEAVLAGTPALTTGWGGQRIFAGNPMVHFIDYTFAPAQSHLGAWDSVWAEPDTADLVRQLKAQCLAAKPDAKTRKDAAAQIMAEHSWDKVAERSLGAARAIAATTPKAPPTVGWITSYNTRCGIATYSAHLIEAFPDHVTIFASHADDRPAPDGPEVRRCWRQDGQDPLMDLQAEIDTADPAVLVIQFNYGFYGFPQLAALIERAKEAGRQVVMMLHATDDSAVPPIRHLAGILPALKACNRLLVHSHHDLNNLRAMGLEENVALFPHGVPYVDPPAPPPMSEDRPVVLGTYGFFLPPKGLNQLIEAAAILRDRGENVALEMVNAEYPADISRQAIAAARAQITDMNMDARITLETAFLEDGDSFARLARADALVFSYQQTAESASGAIRQALALNRPVIATPLRIFDDVDPLILRLPGTDARTIADGLTPIVHALRNPASNPEITTRIETCRANIRDWRQSHAYSALGPRLWRQICGL